VWEELIGWIQTPQLLIEEVEAWRASRGTMHALTRERTEVGAISVEELKARRERLAELEAGTRARAEALTATEGERERLDRVTTDLVAFAATLRDGLAQLNFAGRERLVRLLIGDVRSRPERLRRPHHGVGGPDLRPRGRAAP